MVIHIGAQSQTLEYSFLSFFSLLSVVALSSLVKEPEGRYENKHVNIAFQRDKPDSAAKHT